MPRPFELPPTELQERLEEMVDATFADLSSEFLLMPAGSAYIRYFDFRSAYEALKRHTNAFAEFDEAKVYAAMVEDSRSFCVVRAMLGMTPPEWAELARGRSDVDIDQGAARVLDRKCREKIDFVKKMEEKFHARLTRHQGDADTVPEPPLSLARIEALVHVAVHYLSEGPPPELDGIIHRLDKFDTKEGLASLRHAANEDVPYPVLLYERYLGRPFAAHRDAVSDLVGEVMEKAIEDKLRAAGVSYRKTDRAKRIPGFGQAPDFCIPDEEAPAVVVEAKITSDDGTARDKVARIKVLATQRDEHVASGRPPYEVVACIDGRGFRERREDMRQLLLRLNGKVFTTATIDHMIAHTRIHEFVARSGQ